MTDEHIRAWATFLGEVGEISKRLQTETDLLARAVVSLTADLDQSFSASIGRQFEAARIDSLINVFGRHARLVLLDALESYARLRVDERLPRAFQDFRGDLRDAARRLPTRGEISPREFLQSFSDTLGPSWRVAVAKALNRRRTVPMREIVLQKLESGTGLDSHTEGRIQLFHAQAALALLDPWQTLRYQAFRQIRGEPVDGEALERSRDLWKHAAARRAQAGDLDSEALRNSLRLIPQRITQAVVTGALRSYKTARQHRQRQRQEAYWGRQRRAVRSLLETERAIVQLGNQVGRLAMESVQSAAAERRDVQDEVLSVVSALREWRAGQPNPIPRPKAQLSPASERGAGWGDSLRGCAQELLPVKVESVEPREPLPPWREPWRNLEPRQIFLNAVTTSSELAVEAFSKFEVSHRSMIREVERAREVVTFGIETSENESDSENRIAQESVANAIALLEHESHEVVEESESAEPGVVMATTSCFYQFHLAFEQGTLSLASHLAKEGGYRAVKRIAWFLIDWFHRAARLLWQQAQRANRWVLIRIGWQAPLESGLEPVERWKYLGEDFAIDLQPRQLPLIYARLFRIEPVDDPRFLVGRQVEMAALTEAERHWKAAHRQASVVVIGERGSGKTSLLNCAVIRLFSDAAVIRGRFSGRISTAQGIRSFLAEQIGLDSEDDLVNELNSSRRVLVLEEIERTFLRVVGGSEGVRELLRIIAATSGSTLWILGMTAAAFRFLDASEGAGRFFSHRINASSVERDHLRNAILQRHNLSGFRLEFIPPAVGDGVLPGWIRRRIGASEDPETSFFNRLYAHSDGVFRSAFGLWLKLIDRAEGGVVYMGSPETPDYEALIRGLAPDDLFTLQMIRQHGSLTAEEHARIFDSDLDESRARIAQLYGREIIEPEPDAPGYRVRPEAGALVRAALSSQNFI